MLDSEESNSLRINRRTAEIDDFRRFNTGTKKYQRQYCSIYLARLAALKDALVARARQKWGGPFWFFFSRSPKFTHFLNNFFVVFTHHRLTSDTEDRPSFGVWSLRRGWACNTCRDSVQASGVETIDSQGTQQRDSVGQSTPENRLFLGHGPIVHRGWGTAS